MLRWTVAAGLAAVSMLSACSADLKEGYYACSRERGCPDGWFCVGNRCFSRPGDAGPNFDGGPFDAGAPRDAGPDFDGGGPDPDGGPCCAIDTNPCTDQQCIDGGCVLAPNTDGTVCEPGGAAQCQSGSCECVSGAERCPAVTGPCVDLRTDPMNCGMCSRGCASMRCAAGSCLSCMSTGDCDDGNACTLDMCDMSRRTCSHSAGCPAGMVCVGTACARCGALGERCCAGSVCTGALMCRGGVCTACGGPGDCDDGNPCTSDTCNSMGACVNTTLPDGSLMPDCPDDGVTCNGEPGCVMGACGNVNPPVSCMFGCNDGPPRCCGEVGMDCCMGGASCTATGGINLECNSGRCMPCGELGQVCCSSGCSTGSCCAPPGSPLLNTCCSPCDESCAFAGG